jgi:defect-in-organelle-trafficking protein DotA
MKKLLITVLLSLFPALVLAADGSLSFAPPAGDYSVIFLGNLFGVVDGVLHGSGSQIMGTMFGVFNSAVLALGGIIIMYTLLVSTMNTAQEGQMLGQKWSSMWIPVRSTLGLALLIPKASGYCLMQIFVMWIVVQGVGAADKVWEAALGYLNRGGVIIQAQTDPTIALTKEDSNAVPIGALTMLTGEVCMLGLQKQLEAQRQSYLDAQQSQSGPCYFASQSGSTKPMSTFCSTAVPDFISTVNAVTFQNDNKIGPFKLDMPNFDNTSPYAFLNGICGTIQWNSISDLSGITPTTGQNNTVGSAGIQITAPQLETAQMSRAIAIQQMYLDLSSVAQIIVNNDPQINGITNSGSSNPDFSLVATQQFGVPYTANGTTCSNYNQTCKTWGPVATANGSNGGALFTGTEFLGAISDYNGIMMPTLNLIQQSQRAKSDDDSRKFIADANSQGWMMAGSYFFDLVKLNGSAKTSADQQDTNSGLDSSKFVMTNLSAPCGKYPTLCTWFNQDLTKIIQVESLIDGTYLQANNGIPVMENPNTPSPSLKKDSDRSYTPSYASSTVYGFVNNSVMIQLPGQPGFQPLTFANVIHFSVDTKMYYMQVQDFDCGEVKIMFFSFCLGGMLGDLFYNYLFRYIYNFFLALFEQVIKQVVMAFFVVPLQGMSDIFKEGVQTISTPGANPIIALANMGTMYINFSGNLWIMILNLAVICSLIPYAGIFIFAFMTLAMPLIMAWVGIMVSIGFTTAYYIPILPYMIFTFGTIAWLISVIEAMVAAPIVALGVTHPEGHDAFGKGEAAIMILMNVFLRPAMMIIGYISGIALSYVGVWILNAGFDHAIGFIQNGDSHNTSFTSHFTGGSDTNSVGFNGGDQFNSGFGNADSQNSDPNSGGYSDWAGIYAFFFSILAYTMMYLAIVQKAFTLISYLPDKVLRWIGGNPESLGQESSQWGDELKSKGTDTGKVTSDAQAQIDKNVGGTAQKGADKGINAIKSKFGGSGGIDAIGGLE